MAYSSSPAWSAGTHREPSPPSLRSNAGQLALAGVVPADTVRRSALGGQHARRLQLRRAGFRGAFLQTNGDQNAQQISPWQSIALADSRTPKIQKEQRREAAGSGSEPKGRSPVSPSVLQEISNQAARPRAGGHQYLSNIFNSPMNRSPSQTGSLSPNNENFDLVSSPHDKTTMGIPKARRLSSEKTARRFSLSGGKVAKLQRKPRSASRSTSHEANKYIEHLETELASMSAKLEALTSPTAVKGQSSKVRSLNRQVQILQQDVADWETRFEERVEEQVYERTQIESSMRANLRTLAHELDGRDARIMDLQRDLESTREKLVASEALEADLSHRVDVLTELLSQSPTRTSFSTDLPLMSHENKTPTSLSRSLISPRFDQQNAALRYRASALTTRGDPGEPHDFEPTSPMSQQTQELELNTTETADTSNSFLLLGHCDADSGIDRFFCNSPRLVPKVPWIRSAPTSRPASFLSSASHLMAWEAPNLADTPAKTEPRLRRMRRFAGGRSALKPLLLPTASASSEEVTSPTDRNYWSRSQATSQSTTNTSNHSIYSYFGPQSPCESANIDNINEDSNDVEVVGHLSSSPNSPSQGEALLYRRRAVPSQEAYRNTASPAMASSPLITVDPTALNDIQPPEKTPKTSHKPVTGSSSSSSRTIRIQTPSADLNTIAILNTPSRCCMITHKQKLEGEPSVACEDQEELMSELQCLRPQPASLSQFDRCVDRVTRLMMSLRRKTLFSMKTKFMKSWFSDYSYFGRLGWWLFGISWSPMQEPIGRCGWVNESKTTMDKSWARFLGLPAPAFPTRKDSVTSTTHSSMLVTFDSTIQVLDRSSLVRRHKSCSECREPLLKRRLRLWCKFSLTVVLAIGIAILHGPETLLQDEQAETEWTADRMTAI